MNITTTIHPSPVRGFAALLAAAAIGIAAVAGGTYGLTRDGGVAPAPRTSASISLPQAQERSQAVFYIVASEEDRDAILAAEAGAQLARDAAGMPGLPRDLQFFVVTNAEEELRVWYLLSDVDESVQIVDTRFTLQEVLPPADAPAENIATPANGNFESCDFAGYTDPEVVKILEGYCGS